MSGTRLGLWAGVLFGLAGVPAAGQTTTRVSLATGGAQGDLASFFPSLSADGRFVAFESFATNLVAGDTNGWPDVFVRDRLAGTTERVSVSTSGAQGPSPSFKASISADGRCVAFLSWSSNFVAGDSNGAMDLFVRDLQNGTTDCVSVDPNGVPGNGASNFGSSICADGRFVAFGSGATNLVAGDTNGKYDIFVRDRLSGTSERVNLGVGGAQANDHSEGPSISADGRYVAFDSIASNLVANDTNGTWDVFVHDRQSGTNELVSVDSSGLQADFDSEVAVISGDGRFVAFWSAATNLVPGDTNGCYDIFVHDRLSGSTERVSVSSSGTQANVESWEPQITQDGRFVAFHSSADNLVAGDTNGTTDVFLRDLQAGTTVRVSVAQGGGEAHDGSSHASLSSDGKMVAFDSSASNLVPADTNTRPDVFVRDLGAASPGLDLCQAGAGGVIACPCANMPAGAPRGCDNSSATGGAQLSSLGSASLGSDTLVFMASGERPSATSVLLQGDLQVPGGNVFGQGVSCVGGTLKRLYVKQAAGGWITAPETGEPSVSARSAALGDPLSAGSQRWYAVYYRDPLVLGGCPAESTFNITQTQLVAWGP
jgi:Tol biopolymer transport system component